MAGKKRLLVVEDSEDIRLLLAELLGDEGYTVHTAANGREALDYLAHAEELPDLILLDLMMPEVDGREFREAQEKTARISHIPVLLMTAATDPDQRSANLRVAGYLKKPFTDIDNIVAAVAQFF
jgi:CheY-like chemotaxis protein